MNEQTLLDTVIEQITDEQDLTGLFETIIDSDLTIPMDGSGVHDETLFTPLLLNLDGLHYIPIFDSPQRYAAWTDIISEELVQAIKPKTLLGSLFFMGIKQGAPVHVVLNPHLGQRQFIFPQNVMQIQNLIQVRRFEKQGNNIDKIVHLNIFPAQENPQVILALREMLPLYPAVQKACIFLLETRDQQSQTTTKTVTVMLDGAGPVEDLQSAAQLIEKESKSLFASFHESSFQVLAFQTSELGKALRTFPQPFYLAST